MNISGQVRSILLSHRNANPYKRGIGIYQDRSVDLVDMNLESSFAQFSVKSESFPGSYEVELHHFHDPMNFTSSCTCPYDLGPICKHTFAALKELVDELDYMELNQQVKSIISGIPDSEREVSSNRPDFSGPIPLFRLQSYASIGRGGIWPVQNMANHIQDFKMEGNTVSGKVADYSKLHSPKVTLEESRYLKCDCSCADITKPLCKHGYALIYGMAMKANCQEDALFPLRNHNEKIAEALQEYGLTLEDAWEEDFDVKINGHRIILIPLDPGLSKAAPFSDWKKEVILFTTSEYEINHEAFKATRGDYGILWNQDYEKNHIYLNLLTGKRKKNGQLGTPLRIHSSADASDIDMSKDQLEIIDLLRRAQVEHKLYDYSNWGNHNRYNDHFDIDEMALHFDRLNEVYDQLLIEEHYFYHEVIDRNTVSARHTKRIFPQPGRLKLHFEFEKGQTHFLLKPLITVGETSIPFHHFALPDYGIGIFKDNLYLLDRKSARTAMFFSDKKVYRIRHEDLNTFADDFLLPLMEHFQVDLIGDHLKIEEREGEVGKKLYLKEVEEYLLFIPSLVYELGPDTTREVYFDGGHSLSYKDEKTGEKYLVNRDQEKEQEIWDQLASLHPKFAYTQEHFFSLPINKVMYQNWFFDAFAKFKELEFEILGLKNLQKMAYNPNRPTIRLQASSGTDWFDVDVEVSFGDQKVKLSEIRKAVLNNQQYVKLGDGSIGMLPEEWLQKYSTLFKVGKASRGKLKLSEFQVNAVDDLYEEIENGEIFMEILEKRERLKNFKKIKKIPIPSELTADLRNYQREGYNWLNFLDEFRWGGCLADDMGLGKTVQMLAFLMRISNRNKGATHLIVVPRSLVFNWMSEVEKFCPGYKALRHTGSDRSKDGKEFENYDLIITTYGLARSDIDFLMDIPFHYVVLDESQAIKNPTTQTAKAVKNLKAKNRMIMTGTPIENNTFDLYSQMDFLNPGMLGSLEGFRREFATPIDKNKDEEVAEQLRKMVYPFILSRKKQEVAKDLPEKTETVLFCEMPPAQRKVYDHFKDKYRNLLVEKIETEGYSKAGMYILQGLLKLRQICNSANLLGEEEGQFTKESAKMEVLFEMLDEIFAGGHKVLIFSFFKGMLEMIGDELTSRGIDYVKLTGESQNRQGLVDTFKEDESKQAFLISLKAGGFGLNLAEANYVFLVDPWWNPAVEQQAIDRTHRIGQTQNVFAYKLICKDTIEEKILKLQEKKKALAKDIIHVESGFLKKLNPADVQELFS